MKWKIGVEEEESEEGGQKQREKRAWMLPRIQFCRNGVISHFGLWPTYSTSWKDFRAKIRNEAKQVLRYLEIFQMKFFMNLDFDFFPYLEKHWNHQLSIPHD